jgi:hypothetical protein
MEKKSKLNQPQINKPLLMHSLEKDRHCNLEASNFLNQNNVNNKCQNNHSGEANNTGNYSNFIKIDKDRVIETNITASFNKLNEIITANNNISSNDIFEIKSKANNNQLNNYKTNNYNNTNQVISGNIVKTMPNLNYNNVNTGNNSNNNIPNNITSYCSNFNNQMTNHNNNNKNFMSINNLSNNNVSNNVQNFNPIPQQTINPINPSSFNINEVNNQLQITKFHNNHSNCNNTDYNQQSLTRKSSTNNTSNQVMKQSKVHKYMKEIDGLICHSTHIIGKGSFGKVVYGTNDNDDDICFKFEKICNHKNGSILKEEHRIYNFLKGGEGIPEITKFGSYKSSRYLAMELIGPSLDKYFNLCKKKFTLETTIFLGLQMLDRIEFVHSRGYIHRDIKPNNFLFGKFKRTMDSDDSTLYIIDFGLSASYLEQKNVNSGSIIQDKSKPGVFNINTFSNFASSKNPSSDKGKFIKFLCNKITIKHIIFVYKIYKI